VLRVAAYRPGSGWVGRTLRRLRGAGENAFAVPAVVAGQRLERLMIGGFATGADAEAHGRQLRQGKILEEYAVMRLAWTVELGRFPDRDRAAAALAGLPDGGPTAYLQAAADGGYRLLAGAFASEVEARAYVAATGSGLGSAQVVSR
jgi:cell division septation protein DedD